VAVSSEAGTDFTTIPDLGKIADTASLRNALIKALITDTMFGGNGQNDLPPQLIPPPSEKHGRYWLGYSFEQTLWQSPTDPNQTWGLFGQTAVSDGNPNSYRWSAMGGIGGTGLVPGRPNDRFGVGAFYYRYSDELKKALAPVVTLGDEYGAELFYNFAITKWFRVTADFQVIAPGIKAQAVAPPLISPTMMNNPTVVLLGLRGQVVF
jgi:porin